MNFKTLLLTLGLALLPAMAPCANYFVAPVEGEGLDASLLSTVQKLVAGTVSETGNQVVTDPTGAEFTLKPSLMKLGSALILSLDKVKKDAPSAVAFSGKLKAASAEELDTVAGRLTRSVIKETNSTEETKIGEVTQSEQTQLSGRQIEARRSTFFGLGPFRFNGMNVPDGDNLGYFLALASQWQVTKNAAILLSGESSFKAAASDRWAYLGAAELGGQYYITDTATSPFIGLDLGYGTANSHASNAVFGFSAGARAGVEFFRTSTVQMSLQLRHLIVFADNGSGYPSHSGLVLGINY